MTGIACLMASGGGGLRVPLPGGTYTDDVLSPATATATLSVQSNGAIVITAGGTTNSSWYDPSTAGIGAGYYVKFTVTGTASTNTASTFTSLASNQSVSRSQTTNGSSSITVLVQIATDAAGTNVVTSGTYTLTATRSL